MWGTDIAIANYRDSDGRSRRLVRTGRTPADAENDLKKALVKRLAPP